MSELYLAADVMVTDYSSAMFDFAVTGKPLLFFTYDLAHYRDYLRGFYFDLAAHAPGPLLDTSADVIDALAGLTAMQASHAPAYARFRDKYCHLDQGGAAARVIARYFEPAADRHAPTTARRRRSHAPGGMSWLPSNPPAATRPSATSAPPGLFR